MANPISINEQALILSLGIGILTSLILFTISVAIERIQSETVEVKPQSQQSSSQQITNPLNPYGTKSNDFDPKFDDEDERELTEGEKEILLKKLNELNSQITKRENQENEFLQKRKKDLQNELKALRKEGIVNKRIIKEEGLEEFEPELEKLLNEDVDYSESLQNLFDESKSLPQEIQQFPPPKPPRGIPIGQKLETIPEKVQQIKAKPLEPIQESKTQSTYVKKLPALLSQNLDNENIAQIQTQENLTQGQDKEEMPVLKKFVPAKELFEKFAEKNKPSTRLTTSSNPTIVQESKTQDKNPI